MKRIAAAVLVFFIFAAAATADIITLKDDQVFEADVKSFDSFYVVVELKNGKIVSIPWVEVRKVKHTTTASSWLEEEYMTPADADVKTLVTPLSPDIALQKALYPGIVLHGSGHFYAKDQGKGMSILSAEILSLIIMGISMGEMFSPVEEDQSFNVTRVVFFTGLGIFTLSWLYDIIFSPGAVDEHNRKNKFLSEEGSEKK